MRLYDAHNHLQDDRFAGRQDELVAVAVRTGVVRMVVNGACEADWPAVQSLARRHPQVLPSFGCHPWYVGERTAGWQENLSRFLDDTPGAGIGEMGLDRWKPGLSCEGQEEVFTAQLRLAAARDLPASIHCLKAWGRLHDLLRAGPRPGRGFLLHSYGGPVEMVKPLAGLGAYFSFPGYYLHGRKARQRDTFKQVPLERLLIETDAPDQCLPEERNAHPLADHATGRAINHPANLSAVYAGLAQVLGLPVAELAERVEANFRRLFGDGYNPSRTL
jgi:TatD DNase family protein